jgi:single-strand DNA-binding protein
MAGINKAIILGNVGKDPDVRSTQSGSQVVNLSIATSETWTDKNTGQKKEATEWHRVVFFGKLADIVAQYVKKGSKLYIEGQIKTRSWEQDGQKRYVTEIVGKEMQFLDSRSETGNGQDQHPVQSQAHQPPVQGGSFDNFDDEIPFN